MTNSYPLHCLNADDGDVNPVNAHDSAPNSHARVYGSDEWMKVSPDAHDYDAHRHAGENVYALAVDGDAYVHVFPA